MSCSTQTLSSAAGEIIVLRVAGEVDLLTVPILQAALADSLNRRPGALVVDVSRLTFCSVRGLAQLVRAGVTATENGAGYAVSGCSDHLSRKWSLLWDDDVPFRHHSVTTAMTAIITEHHANQPD